jgi:Ni/Co efflux regulator RcnB
VQLHGELNMRKILPVVVAAVLSAGTFAATADDSVKTQQPPYKPGRQIDDDSVKTTQAPYKPGRQADQDESPVKSGQAPYKPGRQAD